MRLYQLTQTPGEFAALSSWVSSFYPFQRRWLFDPARFAICNKSRKIGLTHTTAGLASLWGIYHAELTTIISVGKTEAAEVITTCERHANLLRRFGSEAARKVRSSKYEVVFASGGRVIALPSTGGRSYSGNVFLDEFAYQPHATEVWDAAAPVALLGKHKMRIVSTPNGVGNEFHDHWEFTTNPERTAKIPAHQKGTRWSAHEIPIDLAIAERFPVNLDDCWAMAKGDPRLFDQFFKCSFLDAQFQYIPTAAIEDCLVYERDAGDETKFDYFAGLDIGREVDLSCIVVVRRHRNTGVCRVVYVETIKRTDSKSLHDMVDAVFVRFKIRRLCIDEQGIGSFPADDIKKKHSERYDVDYRRPRVEPIKFLLNSKEEMATGLYSAVTTGLLQIPGCDSALPAFSRVREDGTHAMVNEADTWKVLLRELASVQRKITRAGNIIYETPRTAEGHADRAWALMLALHARDPIHPLLRGLNGGAAAKTKAK